MNSWPADQILGRHSPGLDDEFESAKTPLADSSTAAGGADLVPASGRRYHGHMNSPTEFSSQLLSVFGIEKCTLVEQSSARQAKQHMNTLYVAACAANPSYSQSGPAYGGWADAQAAVVFIDITREANLYDQIAGKKPRPTVLKCEVATWPSIRELRRTLRDAVFGEVDIWDEGCLWMLRHNADNDVTHLVFVASPSLADS
jgi:hypothetical protein